MPERETALPVSLGDLPREVDKFDEVEWLVVDDGSTDRTVEVAHAFGADQIVRLINNKGLAAAFQAGVDAALKLGADVIVNTDADNQYRASEIPRLVAPILAGRADMVIGDRRVQDIEHFSPTKKLLQRLGSAVVRQASGTSVPDTTSGFRAYNREAALQLQVVSNYTYTLESLIQAGKALVAIEHVPIETNEKLRPSRLFTSVPKYVRRNALAIARAYAFYEPLRAFSIAAGIFALPDRRRDPGRNRRPLHRSAHDAALPGGRDLRLPDRCRDRPRPALVADQIGVDAGRDRERARAG